MSIEHQFDPDQHRRDAMMDGSGFSSNLADARLSDEAFPGATELPRTPRQPRKPHVSHRGGRPYPEKSGQDVSRELANRDAIEHPVSPEEQRQINARGRALLATWQKQNELDEAVQRTVDGTERDPHYLDKAARGEELAINAVMRTIHDKRTHPS